MRNIKPLFYLYQVYKYLVFYPLLVFSTTGMGIIASLLAIMVSARAGTVLGVLWSRFNALVTPMFVRVIGKDKIDKKQSYVIVANHQSQYDIFVIYGWLPIDFRWVMKIQLRQVPFLGYACYKLGHVYIDRSNSDSAIASIKAAKDRIKNGTSIMFFPEGHRSDDGKLIEFKKGAFAFALDIGLPILPITIVGTREVLPSNSTDLFPGRATLIIHDPIDTSRYNHTTMRELMDNAKACIQKGLDDYAKNS